VCDLLIFLQKRSSKGIACKGQEGGGGMEKQKNASALALFLGSALSFCDVTCVI